MREKTEKEKKELLNKSNLCVADQKKLLEDEIIIKNDDLKKLTTACFVKKTITREKFDENKKTITATIANLKEQIEKLEKPVGNL